jgi:hypothetical protein
MKQLYICVPGVWNRGMETGYAYNYMNQGYAYGYENTIIAGLHNKYINVPDLDCPSNLGACCNIL